MATVDYSPADTGYGNVYLDTLILGSRWSGTVTFAFGATAGESWTQAEQDAFRLAFSLFAEYTNLSFQEVASVADANLGEYEMPATTWSGTIPYADHNFPGADQDPGGADARGRFNADDPSWVVFDQGSEAFLTIIHELGHGIGLAHPHDGGGPGNDLFPGVPYNATGTTGDNGLNQGIWTMMSYIDGWNVEPSPTNTAIGYGVEGTPMAFDIAALQILYGTDWTTRAGNDTYVLPSANGIGTFWSCIWDGGGIDTITHAGAAGAAVIDLRAAPLTGPNAAGWVSWQAGMKGGFTIANQVVIENAIGGGGADTITGNDAANTIEGGAGGDLIDGGAGKDVISYASSTGGVRVDLGRLDTDPPSGGDAQGDTLSGFEGIIGGNGDDWLGGVGNVGGSYVDGGRGADTVFAGDDADTLRGGLGSDLIQGNGGDDTLYGADSNLVRNGGFEVVARGTVANPNGWTDYISPLDGWGIEYGPGAELFTAATGVAPSEGRFGIDLEGSAAGSNVAITQQVTGAEDGVLYRLAFDARTLNAGVQARLEVYWGGDKLTWGPTAEDHIDPGTTLLTYYIDVLGGAGDGGLKNRLTFAEIGGGDADGTLLDNVRMYRVEAGTPKADDLDPSADGDDWFNPGAGADAVFGHGGNDTARFAELTDDYDAFDGGSGVDLLVMDWSAATGSIHYFDIGWENSPAIGGAAHYRDDALGNNRLFFKDVERFALTGGSGYDMLVGGELADTLTGNAGDDTLIGGGGADDLRGGDGFDHAILKLSGNGNNTIDLKLVQGGGSITLSDGTHLSSIESISLEAGDGDDMLDVRGTVASFAGRTSTDFDGHGGSDTLAVDAWTSEDATFLGGDGNDLLVMDWSALTTGITHSVVSGNKVFESVYESGYINNVYYERAFTAIAVEVERFDLTGGTGDDVLIAGALDDRIKTIGGRDIADLGAGSDLLVVDWSWKAERVNVDGYANAGYGGDLATGYHGSYGEEDQRSGTYVGFNGVERFDVRLGSGSDFLRTGDGADTVSGGAGDDHLNTYAGYDVVDGGAGNDRWESNQSGLTGAQPMLLDLTQGGQQAAYGVGGLVSGIEMLSLVTGAGNDRIITLLGYDDQVTTNAGADTVSVGGGRDAVDLGAGSDLLVVDWSWKAERVNVDGYANAGYGGDLATGYHGSYGEEDQRSGTYVAFNGVERFDVRLGSGSDFLRTGDGADTLSGGAGDDRLNTYAGYDVVDGGAGNDRWESNQSGLTGAQPMLLDLTQGGQQAAYGVGGLVSGIEMLSLVTGAGNDRIITLLGYDDQVTTNAGADTVSVGGGRDAVDLGAGSDLLVVDWSWKAERVNVDGYANAGYGGDLATGYHGSYGEEDQRSGTYVAFNGVERFDVRLGSGSDFLRTGDGADTLSGGAGDDHLNTYAGYDVVDGGAGNDRWESNQSGLTGAQPMLLDLTQGGQQAAYGVGGLVSGIEMLSLVTGAGNDRIITLLGYDDQVTTNAGADTVSVGGGRDAVDLGAGSDLLVVDWSWKTERVNVDGYANAGYGGDLATGYHGSYGEEDQRSGTYVAFNGVERFDVRLGSGSDFLRTGDGADTLSGGAGNDFFITGKGADSIDGGTTPSGPGFVRGEDRWTADKSDATVGMVIDLNAARSTYVVGGQQGAVSDIEALGDGDYDGGRFVTGSGGDRIVTLSLALNDYLDTGAGNDRVELRNGRDVALLGAGTDTLVVDWSWKTERVNVDGYTNAGFGGDTTIGYSGSYGEDDQRFGTYARFTGVERFEVHLGSGSDLIRTGDGADTVTGGDGDDHLITGGGFDVVDGGAGNDRWEADKSAFGTAQSVVLDLDLAGTQGGYAGGSELQGLEMLSLKTGAAADLIRTKHAGFDDQIDTGAGNDTVQVAGGRDSAQLGSGSDLLVVDWAGNATRVSYYGYTANGVTGDLANGYAGTFGEDDARFGIRVDFAGVERFDLRLGAGNDDVRAGDGADSLSGGDGNDFLAALAGADTLSGGTGNDTLDGGSGDDTLDGGAGADSMSGGTGNDLFIVDNAADLVADTSGADTVRASVDFALVTGLETLVLTGTALNGTGNGSNNLIIGNGFDNVLNGVSGDDTLDGGLGNDTLQGALGADSLLGGDGADSLNGAGGADTMSGGAGDDAYVVDDAGDVLQDSSGVDVVYTGLTFTLATGFENLTLTGGNAVNGTGNGSANHLIGNNAANSLAGGGGNDMLEGLNGNDTLTGGAGADTMIGGIGSDRYVVDNAADVVAENPGEGSDIVVATVSWTLAADVENLQFTGTANLVGTGNAGINRLSGNDGNNLLTGLDGNDNILGGAGADTLIGGDGRDALTGGTGADWFLYQNATQGIDKIVDFAHAQDKIAILAAGFGGGLLAGALDPAGFVAQPSNLATSAAGVPQFIYNTATGVLSYDEDGVGGAASVRIATLTGAPAVSASDFILV